MRSGKRQIMERTELSDHERGRLEADTIKQVEMKENIRKEYVRQTKKLETKLYSKTLIKGINARAVLS